MRTVSLVISMAVGAYVVWNLASASPDPAASCRDKTGCADAIPGPPPKDRRQGLRIEVYDPATEPRFHAQDPEAAPVWISSAETPWIVDGGGAGGAPSGAVPASPRNVRVSGLGQAGASGVCLAVDGGMRRCLAFIRAHDE